MSTEAAVVTSVSEVKEAANDSVHLSSTEGTNAAAKLAEHFASNITVEGAGFKVNDNAINEGLTILGTNLQAIIDAQHMSELVGNAIVKAAGHKAIDHMAATGNQDVAAVAGKFDIGQHRYNVDFSRQTTFNVPTRGESGTTPVVYHGNPSVRVRVANSGWTEVQNDIRGYGADILSGKA